VLADLSSFYVDVTVDEIDVAQLAPNQSVRLTLDAFPNMTLEGTVARIDPLATTGASVTSYNVRIETKTTDERVRSGMSANADIVVAEKANVLMVPRRAVRAEQGQFFVDLTEDQGLCQADLANRPLNPPLRAVAVTTGLSNEQFIEITSTELTTSSCMHVEGVDARLNPLGGPPPGPGRGP
jgi:HlyD family secretion protein